jgi:predicted enzyme related to lactoylglutathione lyase
MATSIARSPIFVLDCPDAVSLASFYSALTGWPLAADPDSDADWAELDSGQPTTLAFQQVVGYQAPDWPGQLQPQQAHLDFTVDDLDAGEAAVIALGARTHPTQPGTGFRVYLDPAGHPFCLCQAGTA